MAEFPAWALILAAGVSFGFGAGGAWIAFGYRLKALEAWRRDHKHESDGGFTRITELERSISRLEAMVTGPTGRNGMLREIRFLRWNMHDTLNWIAGVEEKVGVEFRRTPRPED